MQGIKKYLWSSLVLDECIGIVCKYLSCCFSSLVMKRLGNVSLVMVITKPKEKNYFFGMKIEGHMLHVHAKAQKRVLW